MCDEQSIVQLKGISKSFSGRNGKPVEVLKDLNLTIDRRAASFLEGPEASPGGQFVVLLGPSGCGKSTILNLISGWYAPDKGEVCVFGRLTNGPNPYTATVPQAYTCFPWLTALGNVEFGLALQDRAKRRPQQPRMAKDVLTNLGLIDEPEDEERRREIAKQYLEKVGLEDRLDARPYELSGGMQQRVAIARTLAVKRPIVLMDEPFGALDAQTREDMQQMLLRLWEEEKNTIIFVTHDITEALLLADRIILLAPAPVGIAKDELLTLKRPRKQEDIAEQTAIFRNLMKSMPPCASNGMPQVRHKTLSALKTV